MKVLKKYNGRYNDPKRVYDHVNIAAYSMAHAKRLLEEASGRRVGSREIADYFSECWGNNMNGIEPTGPGVWFDCKQNRKVVKVL